MAIVTISRQLGSFGTEIARSLAGVLKYGYLDKDTFSRSLEEHGLSQPSIDKYDERRPNIWDSFSTDRDRFLHFMKTVIYNFVQQANGIVVGRGGQVLLRGLPGTIGIRIEAPMALRVQRIQERHNCNKKHAEKVLRESDNDRAGFHKFFFNVYWEDSTLYDLTINTETLSVQSVVKLIRDAVNSSEIKAKTKEAASTLKNMILGQSVETKILYEEKIPIQYLEAVADNGVVILRGAVTSQPVIELCEETARSVEGVKDVTNEISLINYYGMM